MKNLKNGSDSSVTVVNFSEICRRLSSEERNKIVSELSTDTKAKPTINKAPTDCQSNLTDEQMDAIANSISNAKIIAYQNGSWYVNFNLPFGVYMEYDEQLLMNYLYRKLLSEYRIEVKPYQCKEIIQRIKIRTQFTTFVPNDETYTLFQNGYLDNNTGQFIRDPLHYFPTIRIEANFLGFNSDLCHPVTDYFFSAIADGDPQLICLIWEFIGYCISSDAMAKVIFFLIGPSGNNGKSTLLKFLQNLITFSGTRNIPIRNLIGSSFAVSELAYARMNISADEGSINLTTEAIAKLKNISGGDMISADVKFKNHVTFHSTCKLIIASNNNIGMAYTNKDPAFIRRICTIPFNVSIPTEKQDPNLITKLLSERDAVVTEAIKHYLLLKNRNYEFSGREEFNRQLISAPKTSEYELISRFSELFCDFSDENVFTSTQELYEAFCKTFGDVFSDKAAFSQAFFRYNIELKKRKLHTLNSNIWGFEGVKLKEGEYSL